MLRIQPLLKFNENSNSTKDLLMLSGCYPCHFKLGVFYARLLYQILVFAFLFIIFCAHVMSFPFVLQ